MDTDKAIEEKKRSIGTIKEAMDEGYRMGLIEGISMYAWWKDGVQYVGSCGTTLKDAVSRINETH